MGRVGPEHPQNPTGNSGVASESGANCGALADVSQCDAGQRDSIENNLQAVVAAWPQLPQALCDGIGALVSAYQKRLGLPHKGTEKRGVDKLKVIDLRGDS